MATATATSGSGQAPDLPARRWRLVSWALRVITIAGLAVDAWVHADLVGRYDPNQGPGGLSQGDLFRAETVVSVVAAVALLLTARPVAWLFACLVSGSALTGLLLYRYYDPGAIGPLPDMYEPVWFAEKTLAGVAEAVALGAATMGLTLHARVLRGPERRAAVR
jgi:hypothetical protein